MGNASGRALPFKPGAPITGFKFGSSPWAVLEGTPTADPSSGPPLPGHTLFSTVTIFKADKKGIAAYDLTMAQNALKRLKMLKHPNILRIIDGGETDDAVMMVTEPAVPLAGWLVANKPGPGASASARTDFSAACVWGVYSLTTALSFLASCDLVHGNVSLDSVWVTRGGDWKLGGFELCTDAGGNAREAFPDRWFTENDSRGQCPDVAKAPERAAAEWALVGAAPRTSLDAYSLGVLLLEVFATEGGTAMGSSGATSSSGSPSSSLSSLPGATSSSPHSLTAPVKLPAVSGFLYSVSEVKGALSKIAAAGGSLAPPPLRPLLTRLLSPSPKLRPSPAELLGNEYFRHPLVGALLFLDELALKEPSDKARFFKSLPALLPRFPTAIAKYRILPALMTALEFGAAGGGGTVVLAPILEIGTSLPPAEYSAAIVPCVVRLFASNDRATRVQLLHHLPSYVEKLTDDVINTSVLGHVATGFSDTNAVLREATVKACLHLAPRLTPANLVGVMLKSLRRCLTDPEPAIRVNATICIGRISSCIADPKDREEGVLGAYLRSMRDPFPHARVAALKAAAFSLALEDGRYWPLDLLSKKVMTAACYCTTDPFADTRNAAFVVLEAGAAVLKTASAKRAVEDEAAAAVAAAAASAAAAAAERDGISHDGHGGKHRSHGSDGALTGATASSSSYFGSTMNTLGWAMSSLTNKILPTGTIGEQTSTSTAGAGGEQTLTSMGTATPGGGDDDSPRSSSASSLAPSRLLAGSGSSSSGGGGGGGIRQSRLGAAPAASAAAAGSAGSSASAAPASRSLRLGAAGAASHPAASASAARNTAAATAAVVPVILHRQGGGVDHGGADIDDEDGWGDLQDDVLSDDGEEEEDTTSSWKEKGASHTKVAGTEKQPLSTATRLVVPLSSSAAPPASYFSSAAGAKLASSNSSLSASAVAADADAGGWGVDDDDVGDGWGLGSSASSSSRAGTSGAAPLGGKLSATATGSTNGKNISTTAHAPAASSIAASGGSGGGTAAAASHRPIGSGGVGGVPSSATAGTKAAAAAPAVSTAATGVSTSAAAKRESGKGAAGSGGKGDAGGWDEW